MKITAKHRRRGLWTALVASVALGLSACNGQAPNEEATTQLSTTGMKESRSAEIILKETCGTCHGSGKLGRAAAASGTDMSRISAQRKTPEGWLMSIARMQVTHGVQVSEEDRRTLVKYLADTQGLAPSESADYRYAVERRLNTIEEFRDTESDLAELGEMCARCHSGARFALQRRSEAEWEHTVHTHLGQWPSLEYQAFSRDRDWLNIALEKTVPDLAQRYPLQTKEWENWLKQRPNASAFEGEWSFSGHYTGEGEVYGVMKVTHLGQDKFNVIMSGAFSSGKPFEGKGDALLYNGHEWRANIDVNGQRMQQVFSIVNEKMQGRMFEKQFYERGLDFVAAHENKSTVLAVQPSYVKAGTTARLNIIGTNLKAVPEFGQGIEVVKVIHQSPSRYTVEVTVAEQAPVATQRFSDDAFLTTYHQVDKVTVSPDYAVARVGGAGGQTERVQARFDALAWTVVNNQEILLGAMPATWEVSPFNQEAKENRDVHYSGVMDSAKGIFMPADAGPNPERSMMSNNIGNLTVTASVRDGSNTVNGEGQLIVGVPVWNTPPIP